MSLASKLNNPPTTTTGTPCSVGALIDSLQGDELEAFLTMLGTPEQRGWPQSAIYDALRDSGYTVGRQTINRHRGGQCKCGKK